MMTSDLSKPRILIVEDDGIIANRISDTLTGAGYPAIWADNGNDAMRQLQETPPGLVLMDIRLKGGMDGVETAIHIRRQSDVPIVYLTAYSDDELLHRAKQTQASGYLVKPFHARELLATIEMALYKHQLDEQKRAMEARIQYLQKMKSLGTMSGAVAHKFNNMLMVIMGYAEMIVNAPGSESLVKSRSEEILKVCEKAKGITSQIIAYTGHLPTAPVMLDLNRIILDLAPFLRVYLPEGSVIRYHPDERIVPICAVEEHIRQIIVNLIINAMEAIEKEKGIITVFTGVTELGETFFSDIYQTDPLPGGQYVFLEISDNGCGMDEETKRRIFDPFFTTKLFGRGLGLSAVSGIVKKHRGAIRIFSKPGEGTRVRVLFPVGDTMLRSPDHISA